MMETYTELIVDKGFNISNECAAKKNYVVVPPRKRGSNVKCYLQKPQKQIKLQKHGNLLSNSFDLSKFLDLLEMKLRLAC